MKKNRDEEKPKGKPKWTLRCPICLSSRNDLWLGGKGGLQMRKCLDCGYVGAAFVSVDDNTLPFKKR